MTDTSGSILAFKYEYMRGVRQDNPDGHLVPGAWPGHLTVVLAGPHIDLLQHAFQDSEKRPPEATSEGRLAYKVPQLAFVANKVLPEVR